MDFSVLMSVYNKEEPRYLKESLDSIFCQTLQPTELILVEDGPLSKQLTEVISSFKKKLNIISVVLNKNKGLAVALNEGLKKCTNDLVIRMDSDDICIEDRFEKQIKFMSDNKNISVSSGQVEEWDQEFLNFFTIRKVPLKHSEIKAFCKRSNPINHPASILRKKHIQAVGGYPNIYPEDIYLWATLIHEGYELGNVPDILVKMRAGIPMIKRRGLQTLKGEIGYYKYIYSLKFINIFEFLAVVLIRSLVRLSPTSLRAFLYKNFR